MAEPRNGRRGLLLAATLLVLALGASGDATASCALASRPCYFDSQCCPGLVCGPGNTCQTGCRIDRAFFRAGARNPANACLGCQPSRSTTAWSALADGTACSDANPCTAPDRCTAGACAAGPAVTCSDGNRCTEDACDPASGCVYRPVKCDDGDPCTADACDPALGTCSFALDPAICDDANSCTDDRCSAASGCTHVVRSGACDDGNACTVDDACDGATCVGGAPPDCDDGNSCTADACDPASGCTHDGGALARPTDPGAFLVFPDVVASSLAEGAQIETLVTLSNRSSRSIVAHLAFLNGERGAQYCYECDWDLPLRARSTTTLLVTRVGTLTRIRNQQTGATRSCAQRVGFLTVNVEDSTRRVLTDNVLTGSQLVTNVTAGTSFSVRAIAFQGLRGDGNRTFAFDASEYLKFPAYLEGDFAAPDFAGPATAELFLFTLGFRRQRPPLVDCSVIGQDLPGGNQFSSSIQFGCFTSIRLQDIDPEFAFPYLGSERGRIRLTCTVHGGEGNVAVEGGVHGILVEGDGFGAVSGTLLRSSPSAGCPATLRLGEPAFGTPSR